MAIRTLTFTSLYPSVTVPHHGIFVEQRLRHLLASGEVETTVVAPVPWFPIKHRSMGEYAQFASIPAREERHDTDIRHPRFLRIPKVGMSVAPLLMAIALRRELERRNDELPFDLIDAHYFYPDGVAAALLGKWLGKPVVITARGTDINLIPNFKLPRRWILWAAERSAGMIAVSDALRDRMVEIGVNADKVTTLRNGVDLGLFCPMPDRSQLRSDLDLNGFTLLSVGHLIERKGHHLVIEALRLLPEVDLLVVGSGHMLNELQELSRAMGVEDRVRFVGAISQDELRAYYNAADALVLASSREGMANVLLESIACGTPAVATPYWGNPEVISNGAAGQLTRDRSSDAIAEGVQALREAYPSRGDTRRHAEQFGWQATTDGQLEIFSRICGGDGG